MKGLPAIGVILLILGALSFIVPVPQRENHGVSIGGAKLSVQTEDSKKLPQAVGIVLMGGGILCLVLGFKK
jgi:uncharacterized membrane protein